MAPFHFVSTDYPAVAGKTLNFFLRVALHTNGIAPASGCVLTWGLYPVSASLAAGNNTNDLTLGTVVAGSTVPFTEPAASSQLEDTSGDFAVPATGYYVLCYAVSGATVATNSRIQVSSRLFAHYV